MRWCASGWVVECRIWGREVAGSNLSLGYFAPRSTQPSIPPGSVNEYQLRLGRYRQVWLIPIADERVGVQVCEIPWEHVPYLRASAVVLSHEEALYQMYAPLPLLRGSHSCPIDRWHFLWPLSDLEGRGVRGQRFLADLQNYASTVRPRMAEFGTVTQVRKKHICRWSATQPRPHSKRAGPQRHQKLLESYAKKVWPKATKFGVITRVVGGIACF